MEQTLRRLEKKNSCKEEDREKKFMQTKSTIVTFI